MAKIKYSMCWEDPNIVIKGLNITKKDAVLTIGSGGENVFALLLKNPKKIVAIDSNKYQLYLLKLKAMAIKELSYEEFYGFLGFKKSEKWDSYLKLKKHLTPNEKLFWNKHKDYIIKGIIHCGKFETYLRLFRNTMLRLVLTKRKKQVFLSLKTLKEQKKFFTSHWDGFIWRVLFHIFFSQSLMKLLGRDKAYFNYNKIKHVGSHYYKRSKYGITNIPVSGNYFMQMILTGSIPAMYKNHPYLDEGNFRRLKKVVDKIEYVHSSVGKHQGVYSKYNLSDIFEKCSQKTYENVLNTIASTSPKGARICYWNNMVVRKKHNISNLQPFSSLSKDLFREDRIFFYSDFIVEEII